jgi:integrase
MGRHLLPKADQRLLGHSDPRVTMGIYTQVLDNEIDDVGLLLAKAAGF